VKDLIEQGVIDLLGAGMFDLRKRKTLSQDRKVTHSEQT
jgi:hypothetical protein